MTITMATIRTAYGELSWPTGRSKYGDPDWIPVSGVVREETWERLRQLRKETGIAQNELLEAALKQFLDAVEAAQK